MAWNPLYEITNKGKELNEEYQEGEKDIRHKLPPWPGMLILYHLSDIGGTLPESILSTVVVSEGSGNREKELSDFHKALVYLRLEGLIRMSSRSGRDKNEGGI